MARESEAETEAAVKLRRRFLGKTDIQIALILEGRLIQAHIDTNRYRDLAQEAMALVQDANVAMSKTVVEVSDMIKKVGQEGL